MSKKKTTEEFVAEAKALNGDLDSYEKVEYTGNKNKVCITCKVHGKVLKDIVDKFADKYGLFVNID